MLEATILDQVRSIFQPLEARYTFHITCNPEHERKHSINSPFHSKNVILLL